MAHVFSLEGKRVRANPFCALGLNSHFAECGLGFKAQLVVHPPETPPGPVHIKHHVTISAVEPDRRATKPVPCTRMEAVETDKGEFSEGERPYTWGSWKGHDPFFISGKKIPR